MPSRIVTTAYRPKRPPRKRKAVAIAGPAIVRKVKASRIAAAGRQKPEPAVPPPPANDDRKPPRPGARKPAIVTTTSRKRARLLRTERAAEPDDPEADARVKAFFARTIRPRGVR